MMHWSEHNDDRNKKVDNSDYTSTATVLGKVRNKIMGLSADDYTELNADEQWDVIDNISLDPEPF